MMAAPGHARAVALTAILAVAASCTGAERARPATTAPSLSPSPSPAATAAPTAPDPSRPAARGYHTLVGLGDRGVFLFGGSTTIPRAGGRGLLDTWAYRGSAGWVRLARTSAPTASGDAIAYDAGSQRVVVVALFSEGLGPLRETWAYDVGADRWERRELGARPYGVHGARAVYAPKADRLIVLDEAGRTWAYDVDADTWTDRAPATSPQGRRYYAMTYDDAADRAILFGGAGWGDTWAYDVEANVWTEMRPRVSPPARLYHAMAYDRKNARTILFGGVGGIGEQPLGDTWSYDHRANTWTELRPQAAPSARGWHSMAYDAVTGMIVLFGGGADREHFGSDTWIYDPSRNTWSSP